MLGFDQIRNKFTAELLNVQASDEIDRIQNIYKDIDASDASKKSSLDQSFRDCLKTIVIKKSECQAYKNLIRLAVLSVKNDLCSASTPFLMMSDVFDCVSLDKCDDVFSFVEDGVSDWKSEAFYGAGKNYLLRMCNDLLRRLSKSQNTVFCGRIQLFLARLFPLSEKSGLNLMSQFHLDNTTNYEKTVDATCFKENGDKSAETMDVEEEGEMKEHATTMCIDYNMYRKFWSLQDYFRAPFKLYDKSDKQLTWRQFSANANEVLKAFASYKLDEVKSSKKRRKESAKKPEKDRTYFAKYLTSSKLLDLQLSDSNFRRYVLVQFLILFQYLNATVKFKGNDQILTEDQSNWIKENSQKVYQLIKETPPDGEIMAQNIEHILAREENWNSWKNDGCPSFVREKPSESDPKPRLPRARKRSMGEDVRASGGKLKMGSSELTRLWNLCPNNMEACKAENRIFLPKMESYFDECIMQANPKNEIEDTYKDYLKPNFQWKSLRLLASCSPHFFAQTNQPGKPLKNYLESLFLKMGSEKPTDQQDEKMDIKDEEEEVKTADQPDNEDLQSVENGKDEIDKRNNLTKEHIDGLSQKLGSSWKKLAKELNFTEDVISYFESETSDVPTRITKMLNNWVDENDAERATASHLKMVLNELGLGTVSKDVFGPSQ